jgi:asparagine N-glycosylation enzyme membrane subunit Stt3
MNSENDGKVQETETPIEQELTALAVAPKRIKKIKLPRLDFFKSGNLIGNAVVIVSLLAIMYLAIYVRSGTLDSPTVLDYDPWWFFRHAKEIVENNMKLPEWDELSHFPPGRPYETFQGWSYVLAISYKIFGPLFGMTLTEVAKWSTPILAALAAIPAFLLGRSLSNKWGGLCTAIFGVLTPALIGVSMAGYCDTDMAVVFFSFLSVYSILVAIKKKVSIKSMPYYVFAIAVNLAFIFIWWYGWIILLFFTAFIPGLLIFLAVEQMFHQRNFKIDLAELKSGTKLIAPLLIIIVVTNIIGHFFNLGNIIATSGLGLSFTQGKLLLVNISVAELQKINIFTNEGFRAIVNRVGLGPVVFTLSLPLLVLYKLYKKEKISPSEVFLFLWVSATFLFITYGVRFSLLFSSATAVAAGYTIGSIPKYFKQRLLKASYFGIIGILLLIFISTAISTGYVTGDMSISDNWYGMLDWINENTDPKALIVTWWDPGHIIAGYTGHRVMADGAHCGSGIGGCVPYDHNVRIQDMGRVFSISDEAEAISILEKYKELTPEHCTEVKELFGDRIPADACEPIPEMYIIASSDLIQKYYWLTYFGTGAGRNYFQVQMTDYDPDQGVITYSDGAVLLAYQDDKWIPLLNFPQQGVRNAVVRNVIYFENGQMVEQDYGTEGTVDGMVWVDSSYQMAIFMDPLTRDSLFTRMFFFNGAGLEHFELVFQNPEIRLFKVVW